MRAAAVLLCLAAAAPAGELIGRVFVVRVATERSTFHGTDRRMVAAPALPVGENGLLMAVGFALDPPVDEKEVVKVSAVRPDGKVVPARLLGGDEALSCTFFRLEEKPPPVPLEAVALAPGDEVVLWGRHGPLMSYAPRRITAHVDAVVKDPKALYALREPLERWVGCIAATPDGRLVGFVDARSTVPEGSGVMLGVGAQTLVVVGAEAYAAAASRPPDPGAEVGSRAWIGVNLAPFDEDREAFFSVKGNWSGALVTGVSAGSPAAKAGIRLHDVLQSIGPLQIRFEKMPEWDDMLRSVQRLPLNQPLACRVVRFVPRPDGSYGARPLELKLVLEARPLDFRDAPETEIEDLGLKVKPLTQDWRRTRQVPDGLSGVVVSRTARASPTQLAGLLPDDLVARVDDRPVRDVKSFLALLDAAREKKHGKIVFFVRRGTKTLFVAVT
ncbi:MAG: Do family serine endopeptidase, partial [Planctomycetota bacterium]